MKKRWTKQEIKYLEDNYKTHSAKYLADVLGRDPRCIHTKACRMGLSKNKVKVKPDRAMVMNASMKLEVMLLTKVDQPLDADEIKEAINLLCGSIGGV